MIEPEFLTVEDVLLLHGKQLSMYGGGAGLRDPAGLESAVAQAQASFGGVFVHQGLFEQAAAYAFHIAQNQPFVDGNKRTALAAALVFLELNGVTIHDPAGRLYDAMIGLAEHTLDKAGLGRLLAELMSTPSVDED
ncbi:MAG TPA: type II toxin-antitoxin system death-on-curing family toxin [Myxococcales bacterium]|nr:type II toxin-antitoxin system death-on-curing family toxin [Myxococcales bacterium]